MDAKDQRNWVKLFTPIKGLLERLRAVKKIPLFFRNLFGSLHEDKYSDQVIIHKVLKESRTDVYIAAIIVLILSISIAISGAIITGSFPNGLIKDFYANCATTLASITIMVLVIDTLNSRRAEKFEKERIIRQLASRSNDFALDAVRLTRDFGWLTDGSLCGVNLMGANLKCAPLDHANLYRSHMFRVNLEGADLSHAFLEKAFLEGAGLNDATIIAANLKNTNLIGVDLRNADLWQANLEGACLIGANLENAFLHQANLQNTKMTDANLKNAYFDSFTLWPEGFDPISRGAILVVDTEIGEHKGKHGYYSHMSASDDGQIVSDKRPWM